MQLTATYHVPDFIPPAACMQALCEEADGAHEPTASQRVRYGFAFLDAAAARFYVGSANDDGGRANLTALLTQARSGRVVLS